MSPVIHIVVSCGLSILVGRFFKSIPAFFMTFIGGALIDMDHFLDYFLNHSYKLDLKDMYNKLIQSDITKLYVIFHSYELLFCLWIFISIFNSSIIWVAFATGYTVHLVLDQLTNPVNIQGYFLSYRIYRKFDKSYLLKVR